MSENTEEGGWRGSMNRSVCRVMMGVAGLAVLGMTATLAGAQTDEAFAIPTAELLKEKPRLVQVRVVLGVSAGSLELRGQGQRNG